MNSPDVSAERLNSLPEQHWSSREGIWMLPNVVFRVAGRDDEPVLRGMLYLALFVPPGAAAPDHSVVEQPELARYVSGWGRRGDVGIIAVGANGDSLGAAWLRLWSELDRGYGFIDMQTPELSVAVRPEARGAGVGTQLLRRLLQRADESYDRVSLSVSLLNPAVRLYERLGFAPVTIASASMIMVRTRHESL